MKLRTVAPIRGIGRRWRVSALAAAVATLLVTPGVHAAPPPDAGTLLETVKPIPPLPPRAIGELIKGAPDARPALAPDAGLRLRLANVRFSGVTVMPLPALQNLVRPDIGRELSFTDLDALAGRVTKLYRDRGYFIARAYLPQQEIKDGSIEILVLEGHLGKVRPQLTTAGPKITDAQLAGFVSDALPPKEPVTVAALERAMLLVNDLPNVTAHATLVPGSSVGATDLVLEANESGRFSQDTIEADNAGSRYSGAYRFGGSVNAVSLAGLGDLLSARGLTSFSGFNYGRLAWTTPVTGSGLKLGTSATYTDYKLGGALKPLDDRGDADIFSVFSVYPVVRTRMFNLYQTATFETKSLHDDSVAGELADKRINVASLSLSGDETDTWSGGGLGTFGITLGLGHLALDGGTEAGGDATTARTAGDYRKLTIQALRQQRLADDWVLYTSVNAQFASKNLDSSESFSFGGPSGVRAYPVGEAPADAGVLATVELRYNVPVQFSLGALQAQLFYDHGNITLHKEPWEAYVASGDRNKYVLQSLGVGVNLYRERSLLISASAAHKLGSNPDPGVREEDADGRDSLVRFWLQLVKYW
jgi:hemolysin activation/secretion protein